MSRKALMIDVVLHRADLMQSRMVGDSLASYLENHVPIDRSWGEVLNLDANGLDVSYDVATSIPSDELARALKRFLANRVPPDVAAVVVAVDDDIAA